MSDSTTERRTLAGHLPVVVPGLALALFFVIPFGIMVAISFFHNVGGGAYEATLTFENYARLLSPYVARILGVSLGIALLVSLISVLIAFPFAYLLVTAARSTQVLWLIFLLSILSLSETIIGFAWSTLLSRTAGVTNLAVALGLMTEASSLSPGLGAVLAGIVYLAFPYAVLLLYPILTRDDPHVEEAARTLGSSPLRSFFNIVLPMHRHSIVATFLMVFVFTLGSYLMPQILGRPQEWTLSVIITDQAIGQSNIPFAAALAVFLVVATILLAGSVFLLGQKESSR